MVKTYAMPSSQNQSLTTSKPANRGSRAKQAHARPRAKLRPKSPMRNSLAILHRGGGCSASDRADCLGPGTVALIRRNLVACSHQSKNVQDAAVRRSETADAVRSQLADFGESCTPPCQSSFTQNSVEFGLVETGTLIRHQHPRKAVWGPIQFRVQAFA